MDGAEILTSREIPGLLLASGNEGTVRLTRDDNVNLYLSRNSGVTWERVQEGPRVFNWGNYGSLFVSTTAASETSSVEFSWDQGKSWDSCEYYSEPMEVEGIVPIGADSLEFLVYGSTDIDGDLDGYVFYLNFSENMTSVCKFCSKQKLALFLICVKVLDKTLQEILQVTLKLGVLCGKMIVFLESLLRIPEEGENLFAL